MLVTQCAAGANGRMSFQEAGYEEIMAVIVPVSSHGRFLLVSDDISKPASLAACFSYKGFSPSWGGQSNFLRFLAEIYTSSSAPPDWSARCYLAVSSHAPHPQPRRH